MLLKYSCVDRRSQSPAAKVAASKDICSVGSKRFCGKQKSNKRVGLVHLVFTKVVYNLVRRKMHIVLIWGYFLMLVFSCVRIFRLFETPFVITSNLSKELVVGQDISSAYCCWPSAWMFNFRESVWMGSAQLTSLNLWWLQLLKTVKILFTLKVTMRCEKFESESISSRGCSFKAFWTTTSKIIVLLGLVTN